MTTKGVTSSIASKRTTSSSDPFISHGRHFGRTVFVLCNYPSLLTNGILRLEQMEETALEDFSAEERQEHHIFKQLLDSYPGLLERLRKGSKEEILHVGELIGKGASGARGDDIKSLKSAILDWLSHKGTAIQPPLHRNSKIDRGFNHELTGSLLCPAGLDWHDTETKQSLKSSETTVHSNQWPMFLYAGYVYNSKDPWKGLLRSKILIFDFKHIFTSLSSVDQEPKAMCSGNAYLHGMKMVTIQFSLSSLSVFSHTDTVTDSENFHHSILDLLETLKKVRK
ncbi:hypothetical protein BDR05DRAFT_975800 [Suillus weaverae]|nr:hypothetical protein BDR05DRAFT_975800 [Suillus weaverae]